MAADTTDGGAPARLEHALETAEARLRLALAAAELGDWELDLRTKAAPRRSLRHDEIFGYPDGVAEWSYDRFLSHVHPDDRPLVDVSFREALERGEPWEFEARIRRADGERRWIWARGAVVKGADGRPERALGVVRDVTDRKEAEEELEQARREAEEASRAKSSFLTMMSHELRTPLNAMLGYVDLLEAGVAGAVTDRQVEFFERIRTSGRFLVGIIEEVLSLSRLEAGRETVHWGEHDVSALVQGVVSSVESLARQKGLALRLQLPEPPIVIRTDDRKLRQIVLNLVANALKFTAEGAVEVVVAREDEWVRVAVIDTGPGIPAEEQRRIFEPFTQVDESANRQHGGTGLGLAVSASLAELLGGTIGVESTEGEGTTFTLRLPGPADASSD